MNAIPMFSIIVPVYKVEKYLDKCVQSLIGQTYPNIEIILVDDGSPDRCPEMCDAYAAQDSRIKVIHKANGGLSNARNAGIAAAQGEFLIFVDSDDYIELDTCEKLFSFAQAGCDIIIGEGYCEGAQIRMSHNNCSQCVDGKAYLKQALKNGAMPMASVLYVLNRTFIETNDLRFKNGITHEDEEFTPRVFLAAKYVVESGLCFYHYVIREDSITTQKDLRKNAADLFATCVQLQKRYENLDDPELKALLLDSLAYKYLSLFQQGKLYQYGKNYLHKGFVWKNAQFKKTKLKALLFCMSPRLYWQINHFLKQRK